jgi:hypothetical protein
MSKGGGDWTWNADEEKWHSGITIPPGRDKVDPTREQNYPRTDLYDHFSKTFGEYKASLSAEAARLYSPGWANMIDSGYGRGSADKIIKDLWNNLWSDNEAMGEISHYYDCAQQDAQFRSSSRGNSKPATPSGWNDQWRSQQAAPKTATVSAYPISIGPRYDMPQDDFQNLQGFEYTDEEIRTERPQDPSFYDNIYSTA